MNYRPYVSLDIETTGLDKNACDIIEIGAILDRGQDIKNAIILPEDQLHLRIIPPNGVFLSAEPFALNLNAKLIRYLAKDCKRDTKEFTDEEGILWVTKAKAAEKFKAFLDLAGVAAGEWDHAFGHPVCYNVEVAGKNASAFDLPFIDNYFSHFRLNTSEVLFWPGIFKLIRRRVIDVGSMYLTDFGFVPSLIQINERLGRQHVLHRAIDDALDVVFAIRNKYNES